MRKSMFLLFGLGAFALTACEDGPYQTYSPAAPGAGDRWNDSKLPGANDPSSQGFNADFGGGSKQELCTGPEKAKRWSKMINEQLFPPRKAGGLDFAGSDAWEGLTFEKAEQTLCQGDAQGSDDNSYFSSWGDAGEVLVGYSQVTHKIDFVQINQGYKGKIKFESRPGSPFSADGIHKYEVGVSSQIQKDGQKFQWDWATAPSPGQLSARIKQATELYDALMYTFGPELQSETTDCKAAGKCLLITDTNGGGIFGARGVGFYIHLPSVTKGPELSSTPDYLYSFIVKLLPFSTGIMHLKLDAEGPTVEALQLGDKSPKANCKVKIGYKYKDFLDSCINVLQDPAANQLNLNKWLGGHAHTDESYVFNVVGVNFNFTPAAGAFPDKDIIHDDWVPGDDDTATEYILDVRANGALKNELVYDPATQAPAIPTKPDNHGSAAIYREFVRNAQDQINAMLPAAKRHPLADPACLLPDANDDGVPDVDPYSWAPADGCTGLEGMMIPGDPAWTANPALKKLSLPFASARGYGYSTTALRPGDPQIVYCADPGTWSFCGGVDPVGSTGSVWDTSWRRLLKILGRGDLYSLPPETRDRRFFWKIWSLAYVKYLRAATLAPIDLSAPQFTQFEADPDNLFFDAPGGGAERFEYIDRRFVSEGNPPFNVEYHAQIQSGNQQYVNYKKRFERGEKTIYRAMSTNKSAPLGVEENWFFSNIVGSVVLKNSFSAASETKDALFCATNLDTECTDVDPTNQPPKDKAGAIRKDSKGRPLLQRYPGAFGETAFTLGTSHIKIEETLQNLQNAWVSVPSFANPYAANDSTQQPTMLQVLTNWKPKQPQEGFPIPVNGTRSRFYSATSLDFTGESTTFNFDYEDDLAKPGYAKLLAAETFDFLGDVFLCKDPISGDLLSVKMYDSMADILDWIQTHPNSQDNCGIIIQYSPFNNYPDYVAALPVGMLLKVNSGSGFGRVGHVETFVPGL